MQPHALPLLSLLLLCPSLITAAPQQSTYSDRHPSVPAPGHQNAPRPWRKLSDAIIRRIWRLPGKLESLDAVANNAAGSEMPGRELIARYGEELVLRFTVRTVEEAEALAEAAEILFLDVWEFNADWVDIRIAKDVLPSLLGLLPQSLQKSHVPLMQDLDLAQAIFNSYPSASTTPSHDNDRSYSPNLKASPPSGRGHPFFKDYQPLSVISPWMSLMASMFTTHVRRITLGISYEGRDIPALRVGVHPTNDDQPSSPRKTILVVGGSHAREWISTSTVNYLAWSLINSYGKNREITRLLEQFDFVLVPTLNPDGYVYSWETDRLWRKNRQPTSLRFCHGVDLDRTFPFEWDGERRPTNPCSESFAGDAPFDGIEAQRFANWVKNETDNNSVEFVGFLDLHSYSQQVLYPYSYSCLEEPPTLENLEELAIGLAKAIRISRKGHPYKVTSACEGNVAISRGSKGKREKIVLPRMESNGGSALDWFYHEMKVKFSFQIKLRDTGSYGFLLPKDNIIPTGEEILDAVLYLGRFMLGEIGFNTEAPSVQPEQALNKASQNEEEEGEEDNDWVDESMEL